MRPVDLLFLLGVIVIWGSNFAVAKIGFAVFPPLLLMTLRFALVAALLVPFYRLPRRHLRPILILSVTLGSFHFGCMFYGVTHVEAGTASLLTQFQVPFSAVLAAVFLDDRIGWRRAAGMAVAFAGLLVIGGAPEVAGNLFHVALVLAASLSWALGAFQIKRMALRSGEPIAGQTLNCWIAVFALPQMLAISLLLEDGQWQALTAPDWRGWFAAVYMAVAVVIVGYGYWYRMLGRYALNQVMPTMLLVPVVSITTGVIFLGEAITWRTLVGGGLIIVGVAVILIRRPRTTAPMPTTTA
ncbi:MAG: EamA family transporter [Alphaproteobacteria bacterium]